MKYFLLTILSIVIVAVGTYFALSTISTDDNGWKVKHMITSPNAHAKAIVKCNGDGGATVGFYCRLFLEIDGQTKDVFWARTDKIDVEWSSSHLLTAKVNTYRVYDFTGVYWSRSEQTEYFVKLSYIQ